MPRCVRCGGEPLEENLFCERCWNIVYLESMVDVKPVDAPVSPWVKRAWKRELPAKPVWVK